MNVQIDQNVPGSTLRLRHWKQILVGLFSDFDILEDLREVLVCAVILGQCSAVAEPRDCSASTWHTAS